MSFLFVGKRLVAMLNRVNREAPLNKSLKEVRELAKWTFGISAFQAKRRAPERPSSGAVVVV